MLPPVLNDDPSFPQVQQLLSIQTFIAKTAISKVFIVVWEFASLLPFS